MTLAESLKHHRTLNAHQLARLLPQGTGNPNHIVREQMAALVTEGKAALTFVHEPWMPKGRCIEAWISIDGSNDDAVHQLVGKFGTKSMAALREAVCHA